MHSNILLILRPLGQWDIVTAGLRRVAALGRYMEAKAAVKAQWVDDEDDGLREIATVCEQLQADSIYTRYANKKMFRHVEDFWSADDAMLRQHVKRKSDERLLKAVRLAHERDIPILYQPTDNTTLHIEDRLTFMDDAVAMPVMRFRRHEEGISYTLNLQLVNTTERAGMGPVPTERADTGATPTVLTGAAFAGHITVLAHQPGLFIIDHLLMMLADGFSGKLLLPFTKKAVVEIPRRIENDYMHRFILRNVAKAEIEAEGFDISDTGDEPQPRLHAETGFDGRPLLTLRFHYGDSEYAPDSKSNGRVTLTATDDGGFRFTRQMRDREKERQYMKVLADVDCKSEKRDVADCKSTERDLTDSRTATTGTLIFSSTTEMVDWLREHAPMLREKGFDVVQPSDSMYYIGPLEVEQSDTWHGDWLQTDVTIVLDNGRLRIPFLQLRDTILRGEQVYMLHTGELLLIPPEWLKRYSQLLLLGTKRHRSQLTATGDEEADETSGTAGATEAAGTTETTERQVPPPPTLRATLRPYQLAGYHWLWQNFEARTGCCLSDEMGLGKTIQTIALLLRYKEKSTVILEKPQPGLLFTEAEMRGEAFNSTSSSVQGDLQSPPPRKTSLVIAPSSVVHNWRNELKRFAPSLTVCTYTGSIANRRDMRRSLMRSDVVITAYRTMVNDIDYLADQQFGIVIFDESQAFKTATSQVHRAVTRLQAIHRLALSGTPVENNLMELWSLMNVLNPPLLGSRANFRKSFVQPIASQMEEERASLLRLLIAPYFLKRTKQEVLTDLPTRQDEVVVCPMTEEQESHYAEELSRARNELLSDTGAANVGAGPVPARNARQLTEQQRFHVLAAIQHLRHIANGEGKLNAIFDHLESLRGTSHKVLLFSEYVSMLNRLATEMKQRGWDYDMLTGQTRERELVISHFQQTDTCQFFLISLKAGGVGLNLTAADYVMLIDPWWNHAAEEQAIARAHRIGQQQPVFVYRFVSENTLEQQILDLQERKQTLIDSVMPFLELDKKS